MTDQLHSLQGLGRRLLEIHHYLQKVTTGKLPINHGIIYNLQNIFNMLPNLNNKDLANAFAIKTNDELLVIYLGSLIRAVIAMHNLIDNKIMNRDAERIEDGLANGEKKDVKKEESAENEKKDGDKKVDNAASPKKI
jgi:26S proteasome regulatory subunit N8